MKKIEIKGVEKYTQMQNQLITELKSYITNDVNLLITNGNLASILLYCAGYKLNDNVPKLEKDKNGKAKMYNLGKLDELQIMVDPYMRWDDNRIIFKNDDVTIEEIEIIDEENSLI